MPRHTMDAPHLQPLHDSREYRVARGEPDIRNWAVITNDGSLVGEVDDVLVDTDALRIRYVDIALDKPFRDKGARDRHVVVPVESVRLDRTRAIVALPGLTVREIASLPAYDHQRITRDFEDRLRQHFQRGSGPEAARGIATTEEEAAIGRRPAGAARVVKETETERVRQTVPLEHEELVIEHRAPRPGAAAAGSANDRELRIPLMKEEAVVEKRTVPKEEVVIRKRTVRRDEVVETDLESEQVKVTGEDGVRVREDRKK